MPRLKHYICMTWKSPVAHTVLFTTIISDYIFSHFLKNTYKISTKKTSENMSMGQFYKETASWSVPLEILLLTEQFNVSFSVLQK